MEDESMKFRNLSSTFIEKLRSASSKSKEGTQATIFRVPENIRSTNVDSFEPKMVSLGPYHHGKQRFRATDERIKLPYASNFFQRRNANLEYVHSVVDKFKEWESEFRDAYSEQFSMPSSEFVEMMLLDFAFMAEFLWERLGEGGHLMAEFMWEQEGGGHRTEIKEKWAAPLIVNDMLIVENQIPFRPFSSLSDRSLMGRCYALIKEVHQNLSPTTELFECSPTSVETSAHFLDLLHSRFVRGLRDKASRVQYTADLAFLPSAEMLQAMRIQFKNKTDGSSFLDITFDESKRSMEIPQLVINDDNISLLRNLIAFEQQCHWVRKNISTYVWFMDCLINTDKDVAVLRQHNIIVSRLRSDEEVAHIFNKLRRTDALVVKFDFDNFYVAEVVNNVVSYCFNRWNRLWAVWNFSWLKQNYFKNRWVTIGVTGIVFFNLLALVQTVYAILSYAKQ